jgi:hypothetical protein
VAFPLCLGIQPRAGAVLLSAAGQPAVRGRVGKKTVFLLKNPAQWVFLGFFDFFGVFLVFLYICPEERVFRVFSVSRILLGAFRH